jgi:hypothetical protein
VNEAAKALMAKARESLASATDLRAGASERSRQSSLLRHVSRCAGRAGNARHRYRRPAARDDHRPLWKGVRKGRPARSGAWRALNKTLELRREGDYDLGSPDPDDVRAALQNAEALVEAISELCGPDV